MDAVNFNVVNSVSFPNTYCYVTEHFKINIFFKLMIISHLKVWHDCAYKVCRNYNFIWIFQ